MESDEKKSVPATKIIQAINKSIPNALKTCAMASTSTSAPVAASSAGAKTEKVARAGDKTTPVFISYQSDFVERATQLKRAIEARGIPCWMATDDLVGNVQDAIGEALMVASAIIICCSKTYCQSQYEPCYFYIYVLNVYSFCTFVDTVREKRTQHFD